MLGCVAAGDRGRGSGVAAEDDWMPPALELPDADAKTEFWLSELGLYADMAQKRLAPDLLEFAPAYWLWSDASDKRRWLRLPAGEQIDSTDMDHWEFPVGTLLFKEFSKAGKRIETRIIARTGDDRDDSWMGAFVWNDDESDARFAPGGERDARGTEHDVPKVKHCHGCHNGERGRVLGFSAVQQPDVDADLLSDPPASAFVPPGAEIASAALGYLHANCAHCHNPSGAARPDTDLNLRLAVEDRAPEATHAYLTTLGKAMRPVKGSSLTTRVVPGDPQHSGLLFRMMERRPETQMPTLGTELVDEEGIALVRAWIDSL
jgi:hypothetical protein